MKIMLISVESENSDIVVDIENINQAWSIIEQESVNAKLSLFYKKVSQRMLPT